MTKQSATRTVRLPLAHVRRRAGSTDAGAFRHGDGARLQAAARRLAVLGGTRAAAGLPAAADRVLAALLVLLLAPVLTLRAGAALLVGGRVFDRAPAIGRRGAPVSRLAFAGRLPARELAVLFNVLCGDLALVGPTERSLAHRSPARRAQLLQARPGVISPADARRRLAIDHDGEDSLLDAFQRDASLRGRAGIVVRSLLSRAAYGEQAFPAPPELTFFGVRVANVTMDEAVRWISDRSREDGPVFVPFVNPHCLNIACADEDYRQVLARADRVLPDGSGIRVGCRIKRQRLAGNVNGTDLFPRLCGRMAQTGGSIFLLGAAPGIAEQVAGNMSARFPGLRVAGTRDGFFTAAEEADVIRQINDSGASILLVAMGVPLQEKWIARNLDRLEVPVCLGVGGLFDFYSGRIPRAPMWLRELGLEWTWRLLQEPGRMWRRYLVGNPLFLARVLRETRAARAAAQPMQARSPLGVRLAILQARCRRRLWLLTQRADHALRRTIDTLGAGGLLLAGAPLLGLVALAIRLESPGPVFFSQPRVGRFGREFRFWKFRSMYVDAEARLAELQARNEMDGGVLFKMRHDPRVTRVGRFIRRFSIDELPQLWNVLRGDMSLVGPRPALPREVAQYAVADRARLDAMPGITCIWQVSGRSEIPFDRQVEMDRAYIQRASARTNFELLLKTVPAVLGGRGAY